MPARPFVEMRANGWVAGNTPIGNKSIEHPHLFLGRQIAAVHLMQQCCPIIAKCVHVGRQVIPTRKIRDEVGSP